MTTDHTTDASLLLDAPGWDEGAPITEMELTGIAQRADHHLTDITRLGDTRRVILCLDCITDDGAVTFEAGPLWMA
jgi:hypothetical protein